MRVCESECVCEVYVRRHSHSHSHALLFLLTLAEAVEEGLQEEEAVAEWHARRIGAQLNRRGEAGQTTERKRKEMQMRKAKAKAARTRGTIVTRQTQPHGVDMTPGLTAHSLHAPHPGHHPAVRHARTTILTCVQCTHVCVRVCVTLRQPLDFAVALQ